MIIVDCEQRSEQWHQARRGVITASAADRLLTATKLKTYAQTLLVESLTNETRDVFVNESMQWGIDHEQEAIDWYYFTTGEPTIQVGFCLHDDICSYGCSPDGLIGDDGLIEVKCPTSRIHIENIDNGPSSVYIAQMQWQMYVTNRQWCDFVSYDPRFPDDLRGAIFRVARDEHMIEQLKKGAAKVIKYMQDFKVKVARKIKAPF